MRNIQTTTAAMNVSKVKALFRYLFVESRSFDLLFKQLVTTIVRNESIQCSSSLILKTPAYLFSIGRQCRFTAASQQKYNRHEQALGYQTCRVHAVAFVCDFMICRTNGLICFYRTHNLR